MRIALIGIALIGLGVTAYLIWPELFGFCAPYMTSRGPVCPSPYGYPYGVTFLPLSIAFLVSAILALFVTLPTYKRWLRFSAGFAVFAGILLLGLPSMNFAGFPLTTVDLIAPPIAGIYAILSVLLFGISDLRARRRQR